MNPELRLYLEEIRREIQHLRTETRNDDDKTRVLVETLQSEVRSTAAARVASLCEAMDQYLREQGEALNARLGSLESIVRDLTAEVRAGRR